MNGESSIRQRWLMEESITVKMAAEGQRASRLVLHFINELRRPQPVVTVEIRCAEQTIDAMGKNYTNYTVRVRQDSMEWVCRKRFSDFERLHKSLRDQEKSASDRISNRILPKLPGKDLLGRSKQQGTLVEKRKQGLQLYLTELLAATRDRPNALVLSFLGMLTVQSSETLARSVNLHQLLDDARIGDLILFRSVFPMSQLQRAVTRSAFDHVGIIVMKPRPLENEQSEQGGSSPDPEEGTRKQLHLLEATGDGVTILPLEARLQAYHYYRCCDQIALRRLEVCEGEGEGVLDTECLASFLRVAVLRPYKLTLRDLVQKKHLAVAGSGDDDATASGAAELFPDLEAQSFFCSALVAAALKAMRVLPRHVNERSFWPGSFASASRQIDKRLLPGFAYSSEIDVDLKELELGHSRFVRTATPEVARGLPSSVALAAQTATSAEDQEDEDVVSRLRPARLFVPSLV